MHSTLDHSDEINVISKFKADLWNLTKFRIPGWISTKYTRNSTKRKSWGDHWKNTPTHLFLQRDITNSPSFFLHPTNFLFCDIEEDLKVYFGEDKTKNTTQEYDCQTKIVECRVWHPTAKIKRIYIVVI